MPLSERLRGLRSRLSPSGPAARGPDIGETIALVRRYVVQETLGPLRSLGRLLAFGLAGALVAGLGTIFVLVGILRVLQTETGSTFAGSWSFAPFLLTAAVGAVLIAILGAVALASIRRLGHKGA